MAQRATRPHQQEVRRLQGVREFVSRKINEADKLSDMAENYIEGMERFSQLFFFFLKTKLS